MGPCKSHEPVRGEEAGRRQEYSKHEKDSARLPFLRRVEGYMESMRRK